MDTNHDPDKYGERGRVGGRQTIGCDDGIDHLGALLDALRGPRPTNTAPLTEGRRQLARGMAVRAMEALGGTERVALAFATLPPMSEADVDELARRCGDMPESRRPDALQHRRPNPHE